MIKLKTLLVEQENKYPADAPEHFGGGENIDIFGFQTKHFDICKSAVTLYEKLKENDDEKVKELIIKSSNGEKKVNFTLLNNIAPKIYNYEIINEFKY